MGRTAGAIMDNASSYQEDMRVAMRAKKQRLQQGFYDTLNQG
jgi:hypothetical protein